MILKINILNEIADDSSDSDNSFLINIKNLKDFKINLFNEDEDEIKMKQ